MIKKEVFTLKETGGQVLEKNASQRDLEEYRTSFDALLLERSFKLSEALDLLEAWEAECEKQGRVFADETVPIYGEYWRLPQFVVQSLNWVPRVEDEALDPPTPEDSNGLKSIPEELKSFNQEDAMILIQKLWDKGCEVNAIAHDSMNKRTLLHMASLYGYQNIVQACVNRGADLNQADIFGASALMCAVGRDFTDIVKILLDAGSDIHQTDEKGRNLLHQVVQIPFEHQIPWLLSLGLDKDAQDHTGNTPMHYAAGTLNEQEGLAVLKMLAEAGANCSIRNKAGETPLDLAKDLIQIGAGHATIAYLEGLELAMHEKRELSAIAFPNHENALKSVPEFSEKAQPEPRISDLGTVGLGADSRADLNSEEKGVALSSTGGATKKTSRAL